MKKFKEFLQNCENKNIAADKAYSQYKAKYSSTKLTRDEARAIVKEFKAENGINFKSNNTGTIKKTDNSEENFAKVLSTGKTKKELSEIFAMSEDAIDLRIEEMSNNGYNIENIHGVIRLEKNIIPKENIYNYDWRGSRIITFGVVSDTHLCSKDQQLTHLNDFYNICENRGIKDVYHAGDVTDGYNKRRGDHIYQTFCVGADDQVNYVVKNYPKRDTITTHFIIGNHDAWHITNGGVDIGKMIAARRDDMKYLGCLNAIVNLTPNCRMELNHPLDGASYALSYSIQKYMDSMSGGQKPNILINGHHHKMLYMFYRNIHAIEAGCFEAQTPWMKGKRIAAHVGGFIVTVHVDSDGSITNFLPEAIVYFDSIKNDY